MTETRTTRFGLPQWSAGTDSGSRTDFNEGYLHLEERAAYDDGVTSATLPVTGVVQGRYTWQAVQSGGSGPFYKTLYRLDDASGWFPVGGPTIPVTQLFRGLNAPVLTDVNADAIRVEHPITGAGTAGWGANITYAGAGFLRSGLVLGSASSAALGTLAVGGGTVPAAGERAVFRASADGEHAIVGRTTASAPGDLLRLYDNAPSAALRVDGAGHLIAGRPSAFGSAAVPTTAALAVAPTTGTADGLVNGLLLYGLTGAPELQAKLPLLVLRDIGDANPLLSIGRDTMQVGRLPWTSSRSTGTITMAANSVLFRASGWADNAYWWRMVTSDPTSGATEANPALDTVHVTINANGVAFSLPTLITNRNRLTAPTLSLSRVTNFSANFLDLARLVPDGFGGETSQVAGNWASDGRLAAGAWWRSTGTIRDARQSVIHHSRKRYANVADADTVGTLVNAGASHTYNWATMTLRSGTAADLSIRFMLEVVMTPNLIDNNADANVIAIETLISVNGAGFVSVDKTETNVGSAQNSHRRMGAIVNTTHRKASIPVGATFALRTVVSVSNTASPNAVLRMLDIEVTEAVLESYVAA